MRTLLLAVLLSAIRAMAADVYTFTVPPGENVSGPTGLTLTGWGYSIHNDSSSLWLVPNGLSVGSFLHATPNLLFDFPDVAPGATATELYNPVTPSGLYQILWDTNTPAGFTNSGTFALSAEWCGDPSKSGSHLVGFAPGESQPYSASFSATPEPSTTGLVLFAILLATLAGVFSRARQLAGAKATTE
jgi:hypothetical protein